MKKLYFFFLLAALVFVSIQQNFSKKAFGLQTGSIGYNTKKELVKYLNHRKAITSNLYYLNYPFFNKETLTFSVNYMNLLNAGIVVLSAYPGYYQMHKVQILDAEVYTPKWIRYLYKVHDIVKSFFNPKQGIPIFLYMIRHEGPHNDFMAERLNSSYEHLKGDYKYITARNNLNSYEFKKLIYSESTYNKVALYKNRANSSWDPYLAFRDTQDVISALYYVRMLNIRQGKRYYIPIYENSKRYIVILKAKGSGYTLNTKAGKFSLIKLSVRLKLNGRFIDKNDKLYIFLSTGPNHTPVYIQANIPLGIITATLINRSY